DLLEALRKPPLADPSGALADTQVRLHVVVDLALARALVGVARFLAELVARLGMVAMRVGEAPNRLVVLRGTGTRGGDVRGRVFVVVARDNQCRSGRKKDQRVPHSLLQRGLWTRFRATA